MARKVIGHRSRAHEAEPEQEQDKRKSWSDIDVGSMFSSRKGKAPESPDKWTMRANLLPSSVAAINRDRFIKQIMVVAFLVVVVISLIVTLVMGVLVSNAEQRTEDQRTLSLSLAATKARYNDVQKVLDTTSDIQSSRVGTLYAEIDWPTVTDNLDDVLPSGATYTTLTLSEYQLSGSSSSSSSSSSTSSIWGASGAIQASFTVSSPTFITAKDFIANFKKIPGYLTGVVSSISGGGDSGYTYTGTVSIDLEDNTTSRSDNAGGADSSDRALVSKLRTSLTEAARGTSTSSSSSSTTSSSSSE
ncbi:hypothetical protein [uncultured Bifidobacterium sp.]|uniref:hypothetical protein n=1 Tax=uncultured Bifidobacterium sp. TaxID=165187 RepID=UPI0026294EA1|nr:hypothetical protein [uncultured Bifidobacterium sp.]